MESGRCPTDLSDDEWRGIGPPSSRTHRTGTPQTSRLTGDPCDCLLHLKKRLPFATPAPSDFPPRKTVYDWFRRRWRIDWAWERLDTQLRERLRARLGRDLGTRTLAPGSWAPSERRRPASAGSKGATRGGQEGTWPQEAPTLVDTEGLCSPASTVAWERERHHLRSR
jgi:transposase